MKIGAIVRCYQLNWMLASVLRNLRDVDFVLVATGPFTGVENKGPDTETVRIALTFDNVMIKEHYEPLVQKDHFNECMKLMRNYGADWVLINDADEILLKADRDELIKRLVEKRGDAALCRVHDYADEEAKTLHPIRTHKPVVVCSPRCEFEGNRAVAYGEGVIAEDIVLHHFGYAAGGWDKDWKEKNLWYPKHDYDAVNESEVRNYEPSPELQRIIE